METISSLLAGFLCVHKDFCSAVTNVSVRFCRSKYQWYNFFPLFLFEQFTRFANAYFLMVSILQTIPAISITNGIPTNFLPLGIVLGFDGVVTAREDYKRHKDDAKANSSESECIPVFLPHTWLHHSLSKAPASTGRLKKTIIYIMCVLYLQHL
jgi:hypothetical protein